MITIENLRGLEYIFKKNDMQDVTDLERDISAKLGETIQNALVFYDDEY
ncbi:MAG: hypothetical protein LBB21_05100 [Holosporaceae bacterium]|nr:hypothetical protein [Holosporaceae bacterium]